VELHEDNQDAAAIYLLCRRQVISLEGQPVDLSIPAVKIAMDLHGVVEQRDCLERVLHVWHATDGQRRGA
jgi:hypothetical protein